MDFFKKTVLLAFLSALTLAGCGNNTTNPDADTQGSDTSTTAEIEGLHFTGKTDGADLSIIIADNYLSRVLKGNPYGTVPYTPALTCDATHDKAEVQITNFTYYGNKVDILCKMDPYLGVSANEVNLLPFGSNSDGDFGYFTLCDNGRYYFLEFPIVFPPMPVPVPQDIDYEITRIDIRDDVTFICEGSDEKEYEVTFYGMGGYTPYGPGNLEIGSVFDTKAKIFTGVVSVNLKNYYDDAIDLFFE